MATYRKTACPYTQSQSTYKSVQRWRTTLYLLIGLLFIILPTLAWGATPILEWRMDDVGWNGVPQVVTNARGNRYHGTWVNPKVNTSLLSPVLPGQHGTCGYGQFARYKYVDGSNPDFGLTNQLTVMAWVRWDIDPETGNSRATIMANNSTANPNDGQFWLQHNSKNSRYEFAVRTPNGRRAVVAYAGPRPVAGRWQHVAGVYDGATLTLYVDGMANEAAVQTGYLTYQPAYRLTVGRWAHNSEEYRAFQGAIDEVRIYNVALSAAEVQEAISARRNCGTAFVTYQAPAAKPVVDVRMDERLWRGTTEKVKDSSGNKFHGVAMHGATLGLDQPAIEGPKSTCAYGAFDGVEQYLDFGTPNLKLTEQVTVMAWVRWGIDAASGNPWANVVTNNRATRSDQGQFWLQHNSDNSRFEFVVQTANGKKRVPSATQPAQGVWYHVAGVYDGRNLLIFVDGVLENTDSQAGRFVSQPDHQLTVGRWAHSSENYRAFRGNIDEVRIYRQGLPAAQIARQAIAARVCKSTSLATPPQLDIASHDSGVGVLPAGFTLSGTVGDAGNDLVQLVITIDDPLLGRTVKQQRVQANSLTGAWTFVVAPELVSPGKTVTITLTATDAEQITTTQTLQVQVAPHPIALWHLDAYPTWSGATGEVADVSGSQFHGRAVNGAANREGSPALSGANGSCGYGKFNGMEQYLDLGNPNFTLFKKLTVMAWVRWTTDPATGNPRATIMTNNRATEKDQGQFWLHHNLDNTGFAFAVQTDLGRQEIRSNTQPQQGVWYHVAGVYDGSWLRLFVNGAEERSIAHAGRFVFDPEGQLTLARSAYTANAYRAFRGDVDEMRVYREALTAAQITAVAAVGHDCSLATATMPPVLTIASHHDGDGVLPSGFTLTGLASDGGYLVHTFVDVDDPVLGRTVSNREASVDPVTGQWTLVVGAQEITPKRTLTVMVRTVDSSGQETRLRLKLLVAPLPQALWHMEAARQWQGTPQEVTDATGHGYSGQAINGAHILNETPALGDTIGTCGYATFDGAYQYIDVGSRNLRLTDQLTVMAWVRWDIDPSTGNPSATLVSNDSNTLSNTGQFWLRHNWDNSRFGFAVQTSAGFLDITSVTQPQPGRWYHLAGVYDGSMLSIYVNGIEERRKAHSGTFTYDSAYRLQFGRSALSGSNYRAFAGSLDEVQVYKSALAASAIRVVAYERRLCPAAPVLAVGGSLGSVRQDNGLWLSGSATSGYTLTDIRVSLFDPANGQTLGQYMADLTPEGYWSVLVDGWLIASMQTVNVEVIASDVTGQSVQRVFTLNIGGISDEQAFTYGPVNEFCTTSGIRLPVGADIKADIEAGRAGNTFLLRGGTHFLTGHVRFPQGTASQPVTLKPYNCENVTILVRDGSLRPDDYTVIAGLNIVGDVTTSISITADVPSAGARHDIVIRNNAFSGPVKLGPLRFVGNVQNVTITGNDISHALWGNITIALIPSNGYSPHNIRISENRIRNCGEDCFQPRKVGTFILEDNVFEGPARENLIDIKGLGKSSIILGNSFDCTKSVDPCILLHHDSATGAAGTIEENHFIGCPSRTNVQVRTPLEGLRGTYHFRYNTFDLDDDSCSALVLNICDNCDISHNTFYHGELEIGPHGWPANNTIKNNVFYKTNIHDKTDGSVYTCSTNGMYNITKGFKASCQSTMASNPQFMSPAAEDFRVQNPAYLGTATDGGNIGAW